MTTQISDFERVGKRLCQEKLVTANFGNMSIRDGEGFFITQSGAFLDNPGELVYVPLEGDVPGNASSEFRLHREVYRQTTHDAVVHAHPVHAVAVSLGCSRVVTRDSEGQMFAQEIPVVDGAPGSMEMARNVAAALENGRIVIGQGHGTFPPERPSRRPISSRPS